MSSGHSAPSALSHYPLIITKCARARFGMQGKSLKILLHILCDYAINLLNVEMFPLCLVGSDEWFHSSESVNSLGTYIP